MFLNQTFNSTIKSIQLKFPSKMCQQYKTNFEFCIFKKYREPDGSCNNIISPMLGKSETPYKRYMKPYYEDELEEPRTRSRFDFFPDKPLPNPRSIALSVHDSFDSYDSSINHLGAIFGQFIAHDLTFIQVSTGPNNQRINCECSQNNPECLNIMTPAEDSIHSDQTCQIFTRAGDSDYKFDCGINYREQKNRATHFLDLSQLYGHDLEQQNRLRSFKDGLLKVSFLNGYNREYLPKLAKGSCSDEDSDMLCFDSGDSRTSQNMMLTSIHTIWMREHNRFARALSQVNPEWTDEILFQESRRILNAVYQNIIYSEWLPIIIGSNHMNSNYLSVRENDYFFGYDCRVNPNVAVEFSTAAFRFGHSLIRSYISKGSQILGQTMNLTLRNVVKKPTEGYLSGGLDAIFRGLLIDSATKMDNHFTDEISNHLFETSDVKAQTKRFSLPSINIMRGRDIGLPPYNEFRKFVGLETAPYFLNLKEIPFNVRAKLRETYRSTNDIDAFTGGVSEIPIDDAVVGPTFACNFEFFLTKLESRPILCYKV